VPGDADGQADVLAWRWTDPRAPEFVPNAPVGTVGVPYQWEIAMVDGRPPYTFSSSELPPGLVLDPVTGVLAGVPSAATPTGGTVIQVEVASADGRQTTRPVVLVLSDWEVEVLAPPNGSPWVRAGVALSGDGSTVAVLTDADLGAGSGTSTVYLRGSEDTDFRAVAFADGTAPVEVESMELSGDGRYVAYKAGSQIYLWDDEAQSTQLIGTTAVLGTTSIDIDLNAGVIAVARSDSSSAIVEVWNTQSGEVTTVGPSDTLGSIIAVAVSEDGRFLALLGVAGEEQQHHLTRWDRVTDTWLTKDLPALGAEWGYNWTISATEGDPITVMRYDSSPTPQLPAEVVEWHVSSGQVQVEASGARNVLSPAFAGDHTSVAFFSDDADLSPGDSNHDLDVFVWNWTADAVELVSVLPDGRQVCGSLIPTSDGCFVDDIEVSADGRVVAYAMSGAMLLFSRAP